MKILWIVIVCQVWEKFLAIINKTWWALLEWPGIPDKKIRFRTSCHKCYLGRERWLEDNQDWFLTSLWVTHRTHPEVDFLSLFPPRFSVFYEDDAFDSQHFWSFTYAWIRAKHLVFVCLEWPSVACARTSCDIVCGVVGKCWVYDMCDWLLCNEEGRCGVDVHNAVFSVIRVQVAYMTSRLRLWDIRSVQSSVLEDKVL